MSSINLQSTFVAVFVTCFAAAATDTVEHLHITPDSQVFVSLDSIVKPYARHIDHRWIVDIPDGLNLDIVILQEQVDVKRDSILLTDSDNNWNVTQDAQHSVVLPHKVVVHEASTAFVSVYIDPILPWKTFDIALTLVTSTESIHCSPDDYTCDGNSFVTACFPGNIRCDVERHCPNGEDEDECDFCSYSNVGNVTNFVTSPLYPRDFPRPITCTWLLISASGDRIRLQVFELQLLGEDRLTVGDGDDPNDVTSVILSRKDVVMPQYVVSTGSNLWLTFDTDGNVLTRSVFKLEVHEFNVTDPCASGTSWCVDSTECIETSALCDGAPHCPLSTDEMSCGPCLSDQFLCSTGLCIEWTAICNGITECGNWHDEMHCVPCGDSIINLSGNEPTTIRFPGLTEDHISPITCVWLINAEETYQRIRVRILHIQIWSGDSIVVGEGQDPSNKSSVILIRRHPVVPMDILSRGNAMYLLFKVTSVASNVLPSGFSAEVVQYSPIVCSGGEFRCHNGLQCLNISQRCDGISQCHDYSDETGCNNCSDHQMSCSDKGCVDPLEDVCQIRASGIFPTCPHLYDNLHCAPCGNTLITLSTSSPTHNFTLTKSLLIGGGDLNLYSQCLWFLTSDPGTRIHIQPETINVYAARTVLCNGHIYDPLVSDCISTVYGEVFKLSAASSSNKLLILTIKEHIAIGDAFSVHLLQYGMADHVVCEANEVLCDSGLQCIPGTSLCDGWMDCNDTSDEIGCKSCEDNKFSCASSSTCINKYIVCDGYPHCLDYSDETRCFDRCGSNFITVSNGTEFTLTSANYPDQTTLFAVTCVYYVISDPGSRVIVEVVYMRLSEYETLIVANGHDTGNKASAIVEIKSSAPTGQTYVSEANRIWIMHLAFNVNPEYRGIGYFVKIRQQARIESCPDGEFLCHSRSRCVPAHDVCDGHAQCDDYSDERNCGFCGEENVFANSIESVISLSTISLFNTSQVKDCIWIIGINDTAYRMKITFKEFSFGSGNSFAIGNGLDHTNSSSKIFTRSGGNIQKTLSSEGPYLWISTKVTDPLHSATFDLEATPYIEEACSASDFQCPSGLGCVNQSHVCNGGFLDCQDREDENGCGLCPQGTFNCLSTVFCYTPKQICDGNFLCPDGIDELNCVPCDSKEIVLTNNISHPITSPHFPQFFIPVLNCLWLISTHDSDEITIYFTDIWLEKALVSMGPMSTYAPSQQPSLHYHLRETSVAPTSITYETRNIFILFANQPKYPDIEWPKKFSLHVGQIRENDACDYQCDYSLADICISESVRCKGVALCPAGDDQENCGDCGVSNILFRDSIDYNLTSSGYPLSYPNDLQCNWLINPDNYELIITVLSFDLERGYDYLNIGTGDVPSNIASRVASLTGAVKLRVLTFHDGFLWMEFKTDSTGSGAGFAIQFMQNVEQVSSEELCLGVGLVCGNGYCVHPSARCDGFNDCLDNTDELHCESISCPGSYPCKPISLAEPGRCVVIEAVCDGVLDCALGDDEQQCDVKKCPAECDCLYEGSYLFVRCKEGWNQATLSALARITYALELSGNNASALEQGIFKKLFNLRILSLNGNNIATIHQRAFAGLYNTTWLDLSSNGITALSPSTFSDLSNLEGLSLWDLPLMTIDSGAFLGLEKLRTLALTRRMDFESILVVDDGAFSGLNSLHTFYVDDHRLCCHFGSSVDCITLEPRSPLFACGSLMQNTFLRISMWVLGISAVVGNLIVIVSRCRENIKNERGAVQSFLVLNLAMADFWMGIYMLMIASTDLYYGDRYFEFSEEWQSSVLCKIAGCISLISSEASVGFLTVISVDRFLTIVFPFSHIHLTKKSSRVAIAIVWLVIISISLVANILADGNSEFYGLSDVCIGLPLITRPTSYALIQGDVGSQLSGQVFNVPVPQDQKPAWYFSIALFLGVNLVCFVIVLVCYIVIFIIASRSARSIRRSKEQDEEIKMAAKMALIVGTDFFCWFPIIVMGIMSQTGAVVIPLSMYVWSVVFILPINSSLNPYLYTLAIYLSASRKRGKTETSNSESKDKTKFSIADSTTL